MKPTNPRRYATSVFILLLLAIVFGSQLVASAFQYAPLNLLTPLLDTPTAQSLPYIVGCGVLLYLIGLGIYVLNLNARALTRSRFLVFLNALTPGLFMATALACWDFSQYQSFDMSRVAAPAVALGPPVLVLIFEALASRVLRSLGRFAEDRHWRRLAITFYKGRLAFCPRCADSRLRCGLLYADDDEFAKATQMLTALGPIETCEDEERLRALDRCYRARGDVESGLACLRRLRQIRPETPNLDRRILDDTIKLGLHAEALELLESGDLKPTIDLLLMRQWLYVEAGNYAQALHQIRRIADQEGPPYNQAIRLYRDLMERLPDHLEVRINLGLLLIMDDAKARRDEGAHLLEEALEQDPRRLYLARHLVQYYEEGGDKFKLRDHLKRLVLASDLTPDYYLQYAQMFLDEEQPEEAAKVLQRMLELLPENWRGHHRLAKSYFQMDELEKADTELITTAALAPEESESVVRSLRISIEQRRRERRVLTLAADVEEHKVGTEKRLELIDQMIGMEWIDKALAQCDQLLDEETELMPAVIERLEAGLEKVQHGFRLRDYLADLYFQQGQYSETLRLYREMGEQSMHPMRVLAEGCEKILTRAPNYLEARRELALVRRNEEDWEGIVVAMGPLIDDPTLPAEDRALWVEAAYKMHRFEDAARVGLTLAGELAGETGYMLMLIDILQDAGRYDQAEEVFFKAKEASPGNDRLRRIEKRVITNHQRFRLARLQKKLDETGVLTPAEHYEKAELHQGLDEIEEAIVHYQRAADGEELANLALAKMSMTLCERGMFDLAHEVLDPVELTREAAEEHPELKVMFYQVGRALEKIRQPEKAAKFYKRIFRIDAAYEDVVERIERLS